MDREVAFWLLAALFLIIIIVGPVKYLWTGTMEYGKKYYPGGKRILRQEEPAKFYLYVILEILSLLIILGMAYWVIIIKRAG
jgi:hypothetical protein